MGRRRSPRAVAIWSKVTYEQPFDKATDPPAFITQPQTARTTQAVAETSVRQHFSHAGLTPFYVYDEITREYVPDAVRIAEDSHQDTYPHAIFPNVTILAEASKRRAEVATFSVHEADKMQVGVMILARERQFIDYKVADLCEKNAARNFLDGKGSYPGIGITSTWLTIRDNRRRVLQQLTGGLLLANKGAVVGEPDLPDAGSSQVLPSQADTQFWYYPDHDIEGKSPFMYARHEDTGATVFGFMASNVSEAERTLSAEGDYGALPVSSIVMSYIKPEHNAEFERFAGETIARTLLLPDILPATQPFSEQLA